MKHSLLSAHMAIRKIADTEGVSYEHVIEEMRNMIEAGMNSKDSAVRARWDKICVEGKPPTPEQFIVILADVIDERKEI